MAKTSKTANATRSTSSPALRTASTGTPGNEIDRLGTMRINELQALYAEVTGKTSRCPNRVWLVKGILEVAVPAAADATPKPEDVSDKGMAAGDDVAGGDPIQGTSDPEPSTPIAEAGNAVPPPSESPVPVDATPVATNPLAVADLAKLSVPELQARYAELLGRATVSSNRGYLVSKLRAAQKGGSSASPRPRHQKAGHELMVLPLRMEADLADMLDAAWRRQGLRSRMELIRRSLSSYLASVGETDVAELLGGEA